MSNPISWSTYEPQLSRNKARPRETFERIFARNPEVFGQDPPPKNKKSGKAKVLKAVAMVVGKKGKVKGMKEKERTERKEQGEQESGKKKGTVDSPAGGLGIRGGGRLSL